jgi:hypothetical protein
MAGIWKAISLGAFVALLCGVLDLYVVTLADRWAVQKVGAIGHLPGVVILFVPKLIFGVLVGLGTEFCAVRVRHGRYLRTMVVLGLLAYFVWKFRVVEVWIAPEFLAYVLAVGPYLMFFLALGAVMLFRRKQTRVRLQMA